MGDRNRELQSLLTAIERVINRPDSCVLSLEFNRYADPAGGRAQYESVEIPLSSFKDIIPTLRQKAAKVAKEIAQEGRKQTVQYEKLARELEQE